MSSERGQALVEFALALPLFLLAALSSFALLDAAATQAAVEAGVRRAAVILASTNSDAQAIGAAQSSPWLRGQDLTATFEPDEGSLRCGGDRVRITIAAPGHLGFLWPVRRSWGAVATTTVETEGPRLQECSGLGG